MIHYIWFRRTICQLLSPDQYRNRSETNSGFGAVSKRFRPPLQPRIYIAKDAHRHPGPGLSIAEPPKRNPGQGVLLRYMSEQIIQSGLVLRTLHPSVSHLHIARFNRTEHQLVARYGTVSPNGRQNLGVPTTCQLVIGQLVVRWLSKDSELYEVRIFLIHPILQVPFLIKNIHIHILTINFIS